MFKAAIFLILSVFSLQASQSETYASVKTHAENRWEAFQADREFNEFKPGRSDTELKEEFEEIDQIRLSMYTTSGYELAQNLIEGDLIRAPGCVAFEYNNTVSYYNASSIYIGDRRYIACEGPRSKDIPKFFDLLSTERATHLVRLTGAYEGWAKKCHPYWDGFIQESNGIAYLNIPTATGVYSLKTFHMDHWRDHHGVDPDELLALVLQIRDGLNQDDGLLVVHCSAGVGRTGTFLASLAIVDAIDQGIPFSIEEIVYRLSLQRIYTVAKFGQYITLHRLAEIYLNQKTAKLSA